VFVVAGHEVPETRFASFGEDRIAYQVLGDGPVDLVLCPSSGDCVDLAWDRSPYAESLRASRLCEILESCDGPCE
jgi:hypothetical protein